LAGRSEIIVEPEGLNAIDTHGRDEPVPSKAPQGTVRRNYTPVPGADKLGCDPAPVQKDALDLGLRVTLLSRVLSGAIDGLTLWGKPWTPGAGGADRGPGPRAFSRSPAMYLAGQRYLAAGPLSGALSLGPKKRRRVAGPGFKGKKVTILPSAVDAPAGPE